jgi:hypothetical protein
MNKAIHGVKDMVVAVLSFYNFIQTQDQTEQKQAQMDSFFTHLTL